MKINNSKAILGSSIMFLGLLVVGCKDNTKNLVDKKENKVMVKGSFQEDYEFLKKYNNEIILLEKGESKVAVSAELQGRVMTSTASGMQGASYGWINKGHYESGEIDPQINVYGGEERFWLGPEGGQYSIFFEKGKEFTFDNWSTPRLIDLDSFDLVSQSQDKAVFAKSASLTNYSGFTFDFEIQRAVSMVSKEETLAMLGISSLNGVNVVGYKTENHLKNVGNQAWTKDNGLLSIWILGMYKHSKETTVVLPYISGNVDGMGDPVNVYESFGEISSDRLVVGENEAYFKGDGQYRSKIGLSSLRAKDILGSYDAEKKTLTLVKYNKPEGATDYVNSKWELQEYPFKGDAVNSYNDGPTPGGDPLGPFYELETSSPAAALEPSESMEHIQYTFHFEGDETTLNQIAKSTLGVSLQSINEVFK